MSTTDESIAKKLEEQGFIRKEEGFKIPPEWIKAVLGAIVTALLGWNVGDRLSTKTELTREQANWDTDAVELIVRKLDRIEARLDEKP